MILDVNFDSGYEKLGGTLRNYTFPLERSKCMLSPIPTVEVRTSVSYFYLGLGLGFGY